MTSSTNNSDKREGDCNSFQAIYEATSVIKESMSTSFIDIYKILRISFEKDEDGNQTPNISGRNLKETENQHLFKILDKL